MKLSISKRIFNHKAMSSTERFDSNTHVLDSASSCESPTVHAGVNASKRERSSRTVARTVDAKTSTSIGVNKCTYVFIAPGDPNLSEVGNERITVAATAPLTPYNFIRFGAESRGEGRLERSLYTRVRN